MPETPEVIEDLLREPLRFVWYRIADPPVRYRALQLGDVRFAWTVPPFLRDRSRSMLPQHYALTLRLQPDGDWRVVEVKPFETVGHAEGWARGLWHDARRASRRATGEPKPGDTGPDGD